MGKRKGKGKEKGRWEKDSLRKVGRTDTQVILYSVQCYAFNIFEYIYKRIRFCNSVIVDCCRKRYATTLIKTSKRPTPDFSASHD